MNHKPAKCIFFLATAFVLVFTALFLYLNPGTVREPEAAPEEMEDQAAVSLPEPAKEKELFVYPREPTPGDFVILEAGPLTGSADLEPVFDFPGAVSSLYRCSDLLYAVIGISFNTEPGSYDLALKEDPEKPETAILSITIEVVETEFQLSRFTMPADRTAGWTADRLADDREKIRLARETTELHPLWTQTFILPLEGPVTSEYAAIRIINDNPPRRHSGVDIGAEEGTPVVAPNCGIVRLAEHLLAGGKTVIIDHGLDISSTYMHLQKIAVEEGEKIGRGGLIGTVGMTGYATGPHLHWEVNIGQDPVNPEQLLENELLLIPPAYIESKILRTP